MSNEFTTLRLELFKSSRTWSTLEEVAAAIAVASESNRNLYGERRGEAFRWSLAHKGGPYPLLRISAKFLGIDHTSLSISFRTLPDGHAILCEDPDEFDQPDEWCVLEAVGNLSPEQARGLILSSLGSGSPS